jgi:hypothetical protein
MAAASPHNCTPAVAATPRHTSHYADYIVTFYSPRRRAQGLDR